MVLGDGGKRIFVGEEDHESFLHWLEQVCRSHGWFVHAWVLMGNHKRGQSLDLNIDSDS